MSRILIAEDDTAVREFVRRALEHGGHSVKTAYDGLDALDTLGDAEFDLLITDIVMPGLDGIALALKVAKDRPEMAILMMTGFGCCGWVALFGCCRDAADAARPPPPPPPNPCDASISNAPQYHITNMG